MKIVEDQFINFLKLSFFGQQVLYQFKSKEAKPDE